MMELEWNDFVERSTNDPDWHTVEMLARAMILKNLMHSRVAPFMRPAQRRSTSCWKPTLPYYYSSQEESLKPETNYSATRKHEQ